MLTGVGDGSYASSRVTSERDFSKSSMRYDNTREIPAPATAAAAATSPKFTARRDGTSIVCVAPFRRNSQGVVPTMRDGANVWFEEHQRASFVARARSASVIFSIAATRPTENSVPFSLTKPWPCRAAEISRRLIRPWQRYDAGVALEEGLRGPRTCRVWRFLFSGPDPILAECEEAIQAWLAPREAYSVFVKPDWEEQKGARKGRSIRHPESANRLRALLGGASCDLSPAFRRRKSLAYVGRLCHLIGHDQAC
jgi:hypothetical protein